MVCCSEILLEDTCLKDFDCRSMATTTSWAVALRVYPKCVLMLSLRKFAGSGPNFAVWGWIPFLSNACRAWILIDGHRYHTPNVLEIKHFLVLGSIQYRRTRGRHRLRHLNDEEVHARTNLSLRLKRQARSRQSHPCDVVESLGCRQVFDVTAKAVLLLPCQNSEAPKSCRQASVAQIPSSCTCKRTKIFAATRRRCSSTQQ